MNRSIRFNKEKLGSFMDSMNAIEETGRKKLDEINEFEDRIQK